MQAGSARGPITEINVTPLVDVCLVLVIIFMVLAPFAMQAGIEVSSSRAGAAQGQTALRENVTVELDEVGRVRVNGRLVAWKDLGEAVKKGLASSRDKLVAVNATAKANVGQVVEILDLSKQNGARKLALLNP